MARNRTLGEARGGGGSCIVTAQISRARTTAFVKATGVDVGKKQEEELADSSRGARVKQTIPV